MNFVVKKYSILLKVASIFVESFKTISSIVYFKFEEKVHFQRSRPEGNMNQVVFWRKYNISYLHKTMVARRSKNRHVCSK